MAKELKERKIRKTNKKVIIAIIATVVALAIIIAIIVSIVIINKNKKSATISDSSTQYTENFNNTTIEKSITNSNDIDNIVVNNTNITTTNEINSTNTTNNTALESNDTTNNTTNQTTTSNTTTTQTSVIKKYAEGDATIAGIVREMSIDDVERILGKPDTQQEEKQELTGYNIIRCYYNYGEIIIDFSDLYESGKYIVHKITTTDKNAILTRNLKVGMKLSDIVAAFRQESILYKDDEMVVVGFRGEDPMYATSVRPKIYFYLENNVINKVIISLGSEQ